MTDTEGLRLSFEFFPPKTEKGTHKLATVRQSLSSLNPDFFTVTYGAGGSTRNNTFDIVSDIKSDGFNVAPHLSFGGDDETSMIALIERYRTQGINRIVALRGDMPSGIGGSSHMVHADELVSFIRKHFGDHFALEVAAYPEIHPEASSYDQDIAYLKGKFDAGANSALTQYFFNPDAYFYFIDQCQTAGIDKPIYPGIMPITHYKNLARFSSNCGAEIPRWIQKRLEAYGDDTKSITAFGIDLISELCETLLDNEAPGLHFYTMNNIEPCTTIIQNIGLDKKV